MPPKNQKKTTSAVLRELLDLDMESFGRLADRNESWARNACSRTGGPTVEEAVKISVRTGVSHRWLLANDPSKKIVNDAGGSYRREIYEGLRFIHNSPLPTVRQELRFLDELGDILARQGQQLQSKRASRARIEATQAIDLLESSPKHKAAIAKYFRSRRKERDRGAAVSLAEKCFWLIRAATETGESSLVRKKIEVFFENLVKDHHLRLPPSRIETEAERKRAEKALSGIISRETAARETTANQNTSS